MKSRQKHTWQWILGAGILLPVFFQLGGGIYRDVSPIIDSQGQLTRLPLPVSLLIYPAVLLLLTGKIAQAKPALAMVIGTFAACFLSLWLGADGVTPSQYKLLMIVQVALPLGALVLGQLVEDRHKILARSFLIVLSIIVPLQLLATWFQGSLILTHYLYAFSIYSHFQYVTLIFVCAYAYCLTSLWEEHRIWLCVLVLPIFIYVTASLSFLTIFAYMALLLVFACEKLWPYRGNARLVTISATVLAAIVFGGVTYFGKMDGQRTSVEGEYGLFHGKFRSLAQGNMPLNVQERFGDWRLFGAGIVESGKTMLVGHPRPMPREIRSSPHNWYIDMAYTFGLVSLLPIFGLMAYTVYLCWTRKAALPSQTWWLAVIVAYLVIVDSNFKVTLRQPYPGIFAYFLWGMLLTRIRSEDQSTPLQA